MRRRTVGSYEASKARVSHLTMLLLSEYSDSSPDGDLRADPRLGRRARIYPSEQY